MANANAALNQARKDVPTDSSTVPNDTQTEGTDSAQTPDLAAGKQASDSGDDAKQGGRDIDNVRHELVRKLDKSNGELRSEIAELKGMLSNMSAPAPAQVTNDISQMTSMQLSALSDKVPEAQKGEFNQMLQQKQIEEATDARFRENLSQHKFVEYRTKANQQAYDRWQELNDPQGAFYRETNKVLDEMGVSADSNPRAVLDAANEAGMRLKLTPRASSATMSQYRAATGRTAPAPSGGATKYGLTAAAIDEISPKLANALRKGEFTAEMKKRIADRSKVYDKNRSMFIK